jgi:hypothetical protein
MQAHEVYVAALGELGLSLRPSFLFREVVANEDGSYVWGGWSEVEYADLNPRFRMWAQMVSIPSSVTLHSFHGSHAADREAEGMPKHDVCVEMAWQESTRAYYVEERQVLGLGV